MTCQRAVYVLDVPSFGGHSIGDPTHLGSEPRRRELHPTQLVVLAAQECFRLGNCRLIMLGGLGDSRRQECECRFI